MTFDEVMKLTRTISSETAFDDDACRLYYDTLNGLLVWSNIIEIGLQYGRSTSIAAQLAKSHHHLYYGVDSFCEDTPNALVKWAALMNKIGVSFVLIRKPSAHIDRDIPSRIDLALIDGDHSAEGVRSDCRLLMPRCVSGSYLCFHDYGRESLPDVKKVVDEEMRGWKHIKTAGTLAVFQKP